VTTPRASLRAAAGLIYHLHGESCVSCGAAELLVEWRGERGRWKGAVAAWMFFEVERRGRRNDGSDMWRFVSFPRHGGILFIWFECL
jgi:hypothetical protein